MSDRTVKRIKVLLRKGERMRPARLRVGDSAVVFQLRDGRRIEVDLTETPSGRLLLRSHEGNVAVSPNAGALEVLIA